MTKKLRNKYTPVKSKKWSTQTGNFMTNSVIKLDFYLAVLSAKNHDIEIPRG